MTFTIDGIEWGTLIVKPTETPKVTSTVKPGLSQLGFFLYYNKKKHKLKAPLPFKMSATEHFVSLETVLEKN